MIEFEVRWRIKGTENVYTSNVIARDRAHAKERIWLVHVEHNDLRKTIEFLEINAVER